VFVAGYQLRLILTTANS